MRKIINTIWLKNINNIDELVEVLNLCKNEIHIDFSESAGVSPEYLLIIVNYAKDNNITVSYSNENGNIRNYIDRIDFIYHLNIDKEKYCNRNSSTGKFLEITNFKDFKGTAVIAKKITEIFKENLTNVSDNTRKALDYCFYEVMDNTINHSLSESGGYAIVQSFPVKKEIRVCVSDSGVGIYEALKQGKNKEYMNLSEKELFEKCIEKGVTNGKGQGNGLFFTQNFIKNNNGELIIKSGNYTLSIVGDKKYIYESSFWQGTIVYLRINMEMEISLFEVFGDENINTSEDVSDDEDNFF